MSTVFNVALVGFSSFERSTLESFFRLAGRRQPGYKIIADQAEAQLWIVNADDEAAMGALRASKPSQHVLLVGTDDGGTGYPVQPRPMKLMGVMAAADQLVAPGSTAKGAAAPPAPRRRLPADEVRVAEPVRRAELDGILMEDDGDVQIDPERLTRFGFRLEIAADPADLQRRLATGSYRFVFLDANSTKADAYETCRAIKQADYGGAAAPVVVMLANRGGGFDKARGSHAGCDGSVSKPLQEHALLSILSRFDPEMQEGFQQTTVASLSTERMLSPRKGE